jgi:prepilin-type N-terminal cleavage/methylation domain-containing protein
MRSTPEPRRDIQPAQRTGGFSLVELVVAILILGILAAVIVFAVSGVKGQNKNASCATEVQTVRTAIAAFKADGPTHTNPKNLSVLVAAGLLKAAPNANTPSGLAGYVYREKDGTYLGPPCPTG